MFFRIPTSVVCDNKQMSGKKPRVVHFRPRTRQNRLTPLLRKSRQIEEIDDTDGADHTEVEEKTDIRAISVNAEGTTCTSDIEGSDDLVGKEESVDTPKEEKQYDAEPIHNTVPADMSEVMENVLEKEDIVPADREDVLEERKSVPLERGEQEQETIASQNTSLTPKSQSAESSGLGVRSVQTFSPLEHISHPIHQDSASTEQDVLCEECDDVGDSDHEGDVVLGNIVIIDDEGNTVSPKEYKGPVPVIRDEYEETNRWSAWGLDLLMNPEFVQIPPYEQMESFEDLFQKKIGSGKQTSHSKLTTKPSESRTPRKMKAPSIPTPSSLPVPQATPATGKVQSTGTPRVTTVAPKMRLPCTSTDNGAQSVSTTGTDMTHSSSDHGLGKRSVQTEDAFKIGDHTIDTFEGAIPIDDQNISYEAIEKIQRQVILRRIHEICAESGIRPILEIDEHSDLFRLEVVLKQVARDAEISEGVEEMRGRILMGSTLVNTLNQWFHPIPGLDLTDWSKQFSQEIYKPGWKRVLHRYAQKQAQKAPSEPEVEMVQKVGESIITAVAASALTRVATTFMPQKDDGEMKKVEGMFGTIMDMMRNMQTDTSSGPKDDIIGSRSAIMQEAERQNPSRPAASQPTESQSAAQTMSTMVNGITNMFSQGPIAEMFQQKTGGGDRPVSHSASTPPSSSDAQQRQMQYMQAIERERQLAYMQQQEYSRAAMALTKQKEEYEAMTKKLQEERIRDMVERKRKRAKRLHEEQHGDRPSASSDSVPPSSSMPTKSRHIRGKQGRMESSAATSPRPTHVRMDTKDKAGSSSAPTSFGQSSTIVGDVLRNPTRIRLLKEN